MSYSLDFRRKVFNIKAKKGLTFEETSDHFGIGIRTYFFSNQRCYGTQDWHARGRINAIGAIVNFTFIAVSLFETNINSDVFYARLTQGLLPKIKVGSVLVMDNATFHKRQDMMEAIKKVGIILKFLALYSSDLNPIEKKWVQVKALRKRSRCDDIDSLFKSNFDYLTL